MRPGYGRGEDHGRVGDGRGLWRIYGKATAASFAVEAITAPVRDTSELESVIAARARASNGGLVVMTDSFLVAHRAEITSLAARYRLPAVYPFRSFIERGGLLSYGNDPDR